MSNKQQIEDALKSLIIDDDREFVAMLSGEWGIGKTYFWKEELVKKYFQKKKIVYISLFGQNTLQDIEANIITLLYKYNKNVKKYTKHLDTVGNLGSKALGLPFNISIGSLFSLFNESDFQNIIICFDDFERLSDKIPIKDVMGLISQFKEQKKCKIIMILNEKELENLSGIDGKKHDEVFALYKEKIVDYTFHYKPSQEELFKAIKEDIEKIKFCAPQIIYDFFKKIDLKNIRIMKQAVYHLNHFTFISGYDLDNKVIKEFVEIALNLFVFKAHSNYAYTAFKNFRNYTAFHEQKAIYEMYKAHNSETEKPKKNKKHEKYLPYYYQPKTNLSAAEYYSTNKEGIEENIYYFLDNHLLLEEDLLKLLEENNKSMERYDIRHNINQINSRLITDFSESNDDIAKELLELLEKHKKDMPYLFSLGDFLPFLENIKEGSSSDIDTLERETIEKYIVYHLLDHDSEMIDFIKKRFEWADEYITQEIKKFGVPNREKIETIFKEIIEKRYVSTQNSLNLSSLDSDTYKQHIKESPELFSLTVKILKNYRSEPKLRKTISMIKTTLWELQKENDDYAWKVEQIAKDANIQLDEKEE